MERFRLSKVDVVKSELYHCAPVCSQTLQNFKSGTLFSLTLLRNSQLASKPLLRHFPKQKNHLPAYSHLSL
jgi:hypothetical protein